MLRYSFLPLDEMADGRMAIAIADPSQLMMIDEISVLLGKRLMVRVAALTQIIDVLHNTD
jgi:Type II secretion system (T2SS), protein E, N-terminal domain